MKRPLIRTVAALAGTAALGGLFIVFAPYYSTLLWWELRAALFWLLPLFMLVLVTMGTVALGMVPGGDRRPVVRSARHVRSRSRSGWDPRRRRRLIGAVTGFGGALVVVFGLIAFAWWVLSTHSYLQDRIYYTASTTVSHSTAPELGQRAPYQVAQAQARPNLGDVSGEVVDTTYLPQRNAYSTLVQRRGSALVGYEVVLDQTIPLAGGRGTGTTCRFDHRASLRDGGWWSHNLARAINDRRRGVTYDNGDLYGYCDGQTPIVVVPLKRQTGWLVVTERPAGVALYNGRTGALTFRSTGAGLPGPAYPLSLAAAQRNALQAAGSYWDYRAGRSGLEEPEAATNSGSTTEFVLPLSQRGNRPVYATMLTGRGSATAISAISIVDGEARAGRLAPITLYRTQPEWVSPSAIESRIKADYQDLPNWQNQQVMEVSPLNGARWVATIGNGQNLLYRVTGAGDLRATPATCLLRADGTRIRCGSLADSGGNGVGTDYGTNTPPINGVPSDLTTLTNAQLADLQRRVTNETARRLTGGSH